MNYLRLSARASYRLRVSTGTIEYGSLSSRISLPFTVTVNILPMRLKNLKHQGLDELEKEFNGKRRPLSHRHAHFSLL
jgi:hypothetical protein